MTSLGLDIGGANLKVADGRGWATCVPYPLWRNPDGLAGGIAALLEGAPHAERLAITMSGELCDCFSTKAEGVRHILAAVRQVAGERTTRVYLVDGRFVPISMAMEMLQLAAASNWHALANFACRFIGERAGLLIDIGSTTTDIVPLAEGRPRPRGLTDTDRLRCGELVYSGSSRTPVCAVMRTLPWRGGDCPVAAELFATTADAYVVLDEMPEDPTAEWTADGRPLTKDFARARLARMICTDSSVFSIEDALAASRAVREAQVRQMRRAIGRIVAAMTSPPEKLVVCGSGEFLARQVIRAEFPPEAAISLSEQLGAGASLAGPAWAVAVLANGADEAFS